MVNVKMFVYLQKLVNYMNKMYLVEIYTICTFSDLFIYFEV